MLSSRDRVVEKELAQKVVIRSSINIHFAGFLEAKLVEETVSFFSEEIRICEIASSRCNHQKTFNVRRCMRSFACNDHTVRLYTL